MTSARAPDPKKVRVQGEPAYQGELHGRIDKVEIVYILTTVDTGDEFHQVLAWTLESRYKKYKDTLLKISNSFQSEANSPETKTK